MLTNYYNIGQINNLLNDKISKFVTPINNIDFILYQVNNNYNLMNVSTTNPWFYIKSEIDTKLLNI